MSPGQIDVRNRVIAARTFEGIQQAVGLGSVQDVAREEGSVREEMEMVDPYRMMDFERSVPYFQIGDSEMRWYWERDYRYLEPMPLPMHSPLSYAEVPVEEVEQVEEVDGVEDADVDHGVKAWIDGVNTMQVEPEIFVDHECRCAAKCRCVLYLDAEPCNGRG